MGYAARAIGAAVLLGLASGCQFEAPAIASGDAALSQSGRVVRTWPLNEENLRRLSTWLQSHDRGWNPSFVTPSAQVSVKLVAADGTPWGLYVLGDSVIVNYRAKQFSQTFKASDIAALKAALRVNE
jgi:hypothetical protein